MEEDTMMLCVLGKARAGKDTLGQALANAFYDKTGNKYVLMAYATELKERVQRDFDLSYEQLWGNDKEKYDYRYPKNRGNSIAGRRDTSEIKENYWTAREIMQEYGQFYRSIDPNFWVKALFSIMGEKEYTNVIITDARHPNEADPVKDKDGLTMRVSRNVKTGVHNQGHISEVALDDYKVDYEVKNFGTKADLTKTAEQLVEIIISSKKEIKITGGNNG